MNNESKIENRKSKIAIVGAGPAGTSLAIRLAEKNFPVRLIERERFPRPKLCGEFISPECLKHFRELNVEAAMLAAGGARIAETVFYAANGRRVGVPSEWFNENEAGALSLSRAAMDFRLLERAKQAGVEVTEESSIVNLSIEENSIVNLKARTKDGAAREISADLFVDATGRAAVLGKLADKKSQIPNLKSQIPNRLVGFKAHLENARPAAGACEIYFFRGGYGGLSPVENGLANFCFLIKAEAVKEFSGDANEIVKRVIFQNERARLTLKDAAPAGARDWLAVAVEGFGEKNLNPVKNLFAVGDAGAFIDPFTGSGILMAFESARILATLIEKSSRAEQIARDYQAAHAREFGRRLAVCRLLRRAAFTPTTAVAGHLISALSVADFPRRILARATRSARSKK